MISKLNLFFLVLIFIFLWAGCSKKSQLVISESPIKLENIKAKFAANVSYGYHKKNVFDIFLPESDMPVPLVIFIHGGGFRGGDLAAKYNKNGTGEIKKFLTSGIAFATIDYRTIELNDTIGVLRSLNDSKRCLQFIRFHAKELNIDKTRIALYGSSAGAGTSAWLGFSNNMADPTNEDPVLRESTRVSAIGLIETQATYDMQKWETVVFKQHGLTLKQLLAGEAKQRLLAFYGISDFNEFNSPKIEQYRKKIDFLSLMTADDPEFWMKNAKQPLALTKEIKVINHHALHAKALKDQADAIGLNNVSYMPELNIADSSKVDLVSFIKRKLLGTL